MYSWKNGVWVKIIKTNTPQTTTPAPGAKPPAGAKKGVHAGGAKHKKKHHNNNTFHMRKSPQAHTTHPHTRFRLTAGLAGLRFLNWFLRQKDIESSFAVLCWRNSKRVHNWTRTTTCHSASLKPCNFCLCASCVLVCHEKKEYMQVVQEQHKSHAQNTTGTHHPPPHTLLFNCWPSLWELAVTLSRPLFVLEKFKKKNTLLDMHHPTSQRQSEPCN